MIIHRYLTREILKPLIAVCSILIVIFVSYKSDRYLADVVDGILPANTVISLLFLKATIALEVLLPITLYLSVVIGLGRLYTDSEMTALFACGVSPKTVLRSVFVFSLLLAVLVGTLSLFVRPWAYEKSYRITAQAENDLDFSQ
ncbi:MAG TPA: LptF/LptG family permease, partial [Nitrospirales bacterium]|nr:LptF/LptG family permease [Nitrospirales bacterium]